VPDGIAVAGADGRIAWVNRPFVVMYGLQDRRGASMRLPARTGPAATDAPPGEAPETSLRGIRVLPVEDNDGVATATGRMLESVGATVTRAQGGAA